MKLRLEIRHGAPAAWPFAGLVYVGDEFERLNASLGRQNKPKDQAAKSWPMKFPWPESWTWPGKKMKSARWKQRGGNLELRKNLRGFLWLVNFRALYEL